MLGLKIFWQGSDSNPEPTAWEPCCLKPTAVIYFWIKRVGNFALKKNDPTEWIIFLSYYICGKKLKSHCEECSADDDEHKVHEAGAALDLEQKETLDEVLKYSIHWISWTIEFLASWN